MELTGPAFRRIAGRMTAQLVRRLGPHRLDLAEDAVQDAMVDALRTWSFKGIPDAPEAWLTRAAWNRAIDRLRRVKRESGLPQDAATPSLESNLIEWPAPLAEEAADDELKLLFLCAAPSLPQDAQVSLVLKLALGFSANEIAAIFGRTETAVAQTIVRAKRRMAEDIKNSGGIDDVEDRAARLPSVLEAIYGLFAHGYWRAAGAQAFDTELCADALRLVRLVAGHPRLGNPASAALAALMAFHAARLPARQTQKGNIPLDHQDRRLWDQHLISEGHAWFRGACQGNELTRWHVEAAIACAHAEASDFADTDWKFIAQQYRLLIARGPTSQLALALMIAETLAGERAGIPNDFDQQFGDSGLARSVKAWLISQDGDPDRAAELYDRALAATLNDADRAMITARRDELRTNASGQSGA